MARSLWTGSINFGLVNVPVKAYTAVRDHDVHFHQLDKKSGSRIRYRKVAEETGKEVDADDIAMGFEVRNGRYVTFDDKELEALRPASSTSHRGLRLRRSRRDRPDLLREHLLAGARWRGCEEELPAAGRGDGGRTNEWASAPW